ncbi:hypothetical protein SAMN05216548_11635 [Faunimonas pinastri]|uniref:Uncharacterized protein n=1 Tax=Faunimonas pinastri TaxID=1855383 RepID=A0A1H9NIS2_9HYPH|nr:hypothetical protein [Faunimonas pinastri]SER35874.1 hypothetical protein SAMN05216548_11635 [Faunimonas pinastri]
MSAPAETDFDDWLIETFDNTGSFTVLIVLLGIGETEVALLRSAYLHVIGNDPRWADMVAMFSGAGVEWNGAVFFRAGEEGLVEDGEAKRRLASLVRHLHEDRTIIRDGEFFNRDGLRLSLEERVTH